MFLQNTSLNEKAHLIRLIMAMQIEQVYRERKHLIDSYKIDSSADLHGGEDLKNAAKLRLGERVKENIMLRDSCIMICQTFRFDIDTIDAILKEIF